MNEFLKENRLKQNLTKTEAAKKLGIDTNLITSWEAGRSTPESWHLETITTVYHVSKEDLLAKINSFSLRNNDEIFTEEICRRKDAIGEDIDLRYFKLDLSDLDISVLVSIYLTSSLGASPYHELKSFISDKIELHAVISHLTKNGLIEYFPSKGFLCLSIFGSLILDIVEQEGLYHGFCFRPELMPKDDDPQNMDLELW